MAREKELTRGDLPPDPKAAQRSEDPPEEDTNSDRPDSSGKSKARRASQGPPKKKSRQQIGGVAWATREDRSCDSKCAHKELQYCFFPGLKGGLRHAVPFVCIGDKELACLDESGREIPGPAKEGKPKIKEGVEKHGCSLEVFKKLDDNRAVWYKMLFSMVHRGGDDTPELWKGLRESSLSLHMQPSLPSGSNQVDEEWKDTIRAAKKSIEQHKQIHGQKEAEVGTSKPTEKSNPISPGPTGLTTPGSQGVDKDGNGRLLTSTRRILEQRLESRVAREIGEATAHLKAELKNALLNAETQKAELENALLNAETQEEVHKSLLTQLEAKATENKALEDLITSLHESLKASRSETKAWEKRKNAMDGEMKTLLKDIAAVRQKSAEAAKEAFDEGYAQGLHSVTSF